MELPQLDDLLQEIGTVFLSARVLREELENIAEIYRQHGEEHQRQCIILSLDAFHSFLERVVGPQHQGVFLLPRLLIRGLGDLENGKTPPFLKPNKVNNRPRDPISVRALRAFPAAAMELFVHAKLSRQDAAKKVADALNSVGFPRANGHKVRARDVSHWRDRLRSGSAEDLAVERFRRLVNLPEIEKQPVPVIIEAAQRLLDGLPSVIP
jgi:hypothetical protein